MGFTVTRQGGTQDIEFEEYAILLRQRGLDLSKLQRVPEPTTGRRWLPVWNTKAEAQAFADELKERTEDSAWEVVRVNGRQSEGPLGPIEIQVARGIDGWAFALHPLSRLMLQQLFPGSCRRDSVSILTETRKDFQFTQQDVAELAEQVAIILTGLNLETITETFGGYMVYDPVAKREVVASVPVHV